MSRSPLGALPPLGGRRFERIANLFLVGEVGSTNVLAKDLLERLIADDTEMPVTAIVATSQVSGRGRAGRQWKEAPGGSVALSLVVPWPEGEERVRLPVTAGVAVARGLTERLGVDVRLKWPNDLLVCRKKVGGLLVEARALDEGYGFAIVGVGLNVGATREELDALGLPDATSLREAGAALASGESVLVSLVEALDEALSPDGTGFLPLPDVPEAFAAHSAHRSGDPITVHDSGRVVAGTYLGVTRDGFLRLATASGAETVLSGDVVAF